MNSLLAHSVAGAYSAYFFIANICAVATFILLIYTFLLYHCERMNNYFIVKFLTFSFIFHSAWTLGPLSGYQGESTVSVSYWITGITFGTLNYEYIKEKVIMNKIRSRDHSDSES